MTAEEKKAALLATLAQFKDAQARFGYLVEQGRRHEPLHETLRVDAFRVEGCLAKLWLVPEFKEGRCYFRTDSESAIMKGVSTVLCNYYSGQTPAEILSNDPSFLSQVGITQHLTPNRRNGLARVWENSGICARPVEFRCGIRKRSQMKAALYDAHNHLQAATLSPHLGTVQKQLENLGVANIVVNGTREEDWVAVLDLAVKDRKVIPSFGLHPWHVAQRSAQWQVRLLDCLNRIPAGVGEIGLDRWIEGFDLPLQEEVFVWQLRLAAERNLPVSIHCLRAWGRLLELLQEQPRPQCGFLLHSYGGPQEMIQPLAKLGAYFSISGYFAQERKVRQQEVFKHVPADRLLIETDAPDMLPPEKYIDFPIAAGEAEKAVNNPANIVGVYRFVTDLLNEPADVVVQRTEENFKRLFGSLLH